MLEDIKTKTVNEKEVFTDIELARKYVAKVSYSDQPFELSFAQFKRLMNKQLCTLSGMRTTKYANKLNSRSLDRVDHTKGYTPENTIMICASLNRMKGVIENENNIMTKEHLLKFAQNWIKLHDKIN